MLINPIYGIDKTVNNRVGETVAFYNNGFPFFLHMASLLITKIIFVSVKENLAHPESYGAPQRTSQIKNALFFSFFFFHKTGSFAIIGSTNICL